jgi:glucose repression mediator protein
MLEDLQKAYASYQQALYHLPNPKDPNLWYGIGILYDRYGSYEHAEESFAAVLKMDPKFEKANEIYFRLAIIYKQQMKYDQSLELFHQILQTPPRPLLQADIWFQIGHVFELRKEVSDSSLPLLLSSFPSSFILLTSFHLHLLQFASAKDAYERVLKETPNNAKVLQQLGWLHYHNPHLGGVDVAVGYLMKSLDAEPGDGQTWYVLGRCYMQQQKYRKAYDAYQQAVYRDGRNPTFWCSIGVLYYQINQVSIATFHQISSPSRFILAFFYFFHIHGAQLIPKKKKTVSRCS